MVAADENAGHVARLASCGRHAACSTGFLALIGHGSPYKGESRILKMHKANEKAAFVSLPEELVKHQTRRTKCENRSALDSKPNFIDDPIV